MKIMAFVGSPRRGSNVDTLIDKVIEGIKSKTEIDLKKVYLYDGNIKNCNGCMLCTALHGSKECPLKDDLTDIINRMSETDAFIFGSPNYVHSMSAGLTNLFCRMQPLIKMNVKRDSSGNIIGADSTTLIRDKKAVMVVSQGDFSPSQSALLLRTLAANIVDFKLIKTGEVFSAGNLEKGQVKEKAADLKSAFDMGVKLAQADQFGKQ